MPKRILFILWLVVGVLLSGGCASKPTVSPDENFLACLQLKQVGDFATTAHVSYAGWTPETASRAAERFLNAVDPYEVLFSDAERVALRSAALNSDPSDAPQSCAPLMNMALKMRGAHDRLRSVVLEALSLGEPKGLRSVEKPRGPNHTPEQRDAKLAAAARHQRAVYIAVGMPPLDAAGAALFWFEESMKRVETTKGILNEFAQAFLRSLPGENAILPDSLAQIAALGAEAPLVRTLRADWLPEVTDLSEWGLNRNSELQKGDRIVGVEMAGAPQLIHSWMGEGPRYGGHVLPLAEGKMLPYRYVTLRKDADGVYRGHRVDGKNFGEMFESVPGDVPLLHVRATQFDVGFVTALRKRLDEQPPKAVVLDLRAATGPAEFVTDFVAGVFAKDEIFGYLSFRGLRLGDRKAQAMSPPWLGPLVVLVGPNTCGPAEVLAAGLQNIGRAVVVGSAKTSGQGGSAYITDLTQGRQVLMTFASRYQTNGKTLERNGVTPDVMVGPAATRVLPRFAPGDPVPAPVLPAGTWTKAPERKLASSATGDLKKMATAAAKTAAKGDDRLASAAYAVARALAEKEMPR